MIGYMFIFFYSEEDKKHPLISHPLASSILLISQRYYDSLKLTASRFSLESQP